MPAIIKKSHAYVDIFRDPKAERPKRDQSMRYNLQFSQALKSLRTFFSTILRICIQYRLIVSRVLKNCQQIGFPHHVSARKNQSK